MFCNHCGSKIKDRAKFCPKCGYGIRESVPTAALPEKQKMTVEKTQREKAIKESEMRRALIMVGIAMAVIVVVFRIINTFEGRNTRNANTLAASDNVANVLEADGTDKEATTEITEEVDAYTGAFTDEFYSLVTADVDEDRVWECMFLPDTTDEDWERLAAAFQESMAPRYYEGTKYYDLVSMCYGRGLLSYDFCLEKYMSIVLDVLDGFDNDSSDYEYWDSPQVATKKYDRSNITMWKYSFPLDWKVKRGPGTYIMTDDGTMIRYEILDKDIGFEIAADTFKYIINGNSLDVSFSEVGLDEVTTGPVWFDVLKNSKFFYLDAPEGMSVTHMPALVAYGTWSSYGMEYTFVLTAIHKLPRENYFENTSDVNPGLENVDVDSLDWLKFKNEVEYTVNIFDKDISSFLQAMSN